VGGNPLHFISGSIYFIAFYRYNKKKNIHKQAGNFSTFFLITQQNRVTSLSRRVTILLETPALLTAYKIASRLE